MGFVWCNEKFGLGWFCQFYQCDVDIVGVVIVVVDVEICVMLLDMLEIVGILCGDYIVCVNNCKVLNGVMEVVGVLDLNDFEKFVLECGMVLCVIDKFDKFGEEGVCFLIGEG